MTIGMEHARRPEPPDRDGVIVGAATFARDLGARIHAGQRLRRSEAQLAKAQRITMVGSWEWDIASDTIEWSDELCRIYGITPGVQHSFDTFILAVHPDDRTLVRALVQDAIVTGTPFRFEHRIIRSDGTHRTLLARGEVALAPDRTPIKMLGTGQDITNWHD